MKSQASAGWLACGWAPATCSLMPECSGAQPRNLAACPPCAHIQPLHSGSLAKVAKTYRIDMAEPPSADAVFIQRARVSLIA